MKRILDCQASDFKTMSKEELLYAIGSCEGRAIACETIGAIQPCWVISATPNLSLPWERISCC